MNRSKLLQTLGLALVLGLGGIGAAQAHDDDAGAAFAGAMLGAAISGGVVAQAPVVYAPPAPVVYAPRYAAPVVYADGDWHDHDGWRRWRHHEHEEHEWHEWHEHHGWRHDD